MKRTTWPRGVGDLLEDGLEALLELAAVLRAGDQRADVERDHAPVAQRLGHVAGDDPLGEALGDRGLADAGLADQHRVVLRAAGQDLDDAADLVVAADDRVELALLGGAGEVAAELLERLVLVLGVLVGDAVRAADLRDRLGQRVVRRAGARAAPRRRASRGRRARAAGARWRRTRRRARDASCSAARRTASSSRDGGGLVRRSPVIVGSASSAAFTSRADRAGAAPSLRRRGDHAVALLEQHAQRCSGVILVWRGSAARRERGLEGLLGLVREAVESHAPASFRTDLQSR